MQEEKTDQTLTRDEKALTIMAHDIKVPLTAIVSMLAVINKGYVDDDSEKIKDIHSQTDDSNPKMRHLFKTLNKVKNELHNFSRLIAIMHNSKKYSRTLIFKVERNMIATKGNKLRK